MLHKKSLSAEILFIAIAGPIVLASLFLPNASQMLKPLIKWHKNWDKIKRQRINEAVKRLNQKGLVELIEKNDKLYIEITRDGKKLVKDLDYDNIKLPNGKKWDGKWRMVIFDIPEKKTKERRALSVKLKELGFYPLQESVFIYPYDCCDEIDYVCGFLDIDRYVNYCIVDTLNKKEGDLRKFFKLSLS